MSYKRYVKALTFLASILATQSPFALTLSVDGPDGNHGSRERNYSTSPGASSGRGSSGNDASPSSKGKDAGSIEITIEDISRNGEMSQIKVTGHKIGPNSRRQSINETLSLNHDPVLFLSAKGGVGGNGGSGGDGQGGCNGTDGRDAHKRRSAGDGTDGCNGGNGGDGTSGSNGGNGGQIIVHVSNEDIHLLRSLRLDVSAGSGGTAGSNGRAGSGGRAGRGGDGDRWREVVGTRPVQVSYTDYESKRDCNLKKQGDGSYENVCENVRVPVTKYKTEYEDVYEWFSTSKGRDGSRGRDGSNGSGRISAGNPGRNGNFIYKVHYKSGVVKNYKKPFELKVLSYDVVEDHQSRNGIFEPGEKIHLKNIRIKNVGETPSPAAKAPVKLSLNSSSLSVINDQLNIPVLEGGEEFTSTSELTLQIPDSSRVGGDAQLELLHNIVPSASIPKTGVKLEEFTLQKAIHAKYPVVLTFFDIPEFITPGESVPVMIEIKNISLDAVDEERQLNNSIKLTGGDTPAQYISFGENNLDDPKSLTSSIENLGAGKTALIKTSISLSAKAPVYTGFQVEAGLFLSKLDDEDPSKIQSRILDIKVVAKYRYNKNAAFLLVTNEKVSREEYNAWMELSEKLNINVDIWDLNFNNSIDLAKSLNSGSTLLENYRDKAIIFIKSDSPRVSDAVQSLKAKDFLRASQDFNINFLFMGGNKDEARQLINQYLLQSDNEVGPIESEEKPGFLSFIVKSKRSREDQQREAFNQELLKDHPNRRFLIEDTREGTLIARPTLGASGGQVFTIPLHDMELASPDVILSEEVMRSVLLPLSTSAKLEILDGDYSDKVKDALLYDLITEIDLQDKGEGLNQAALEKNEFFIEYLTRGNAGEETKQIIAGIKLFAEHLESKQLKKFITENLDSFSNGEVENLYEELSAQAKERRKVLPGISKKENIRNMLTLPAVHRVLSTKDMQNENVRQEDL